MSEEKPTTTPFLRPGKIVVATIYLLYLAVIIRTMVNQNIRSRLPIYFALEILFLVMFTVVLWHPVRRPIWQHLYFVFQSIVVLVLVLLRPKFDFIVILYVILSLQAALIFYSRIRWIWVGTLISLIGLPMVIALGPLQGLSLALMPMTIGMVFAAYVVVTQEIEARLRNRQVLLVDLQTVNKQLTLSAGQAEELSAIQERNRLARELHDSVSQTMFSISLYARAAQILLKRNPERLRPQLEIMQRLTHNALEEMRNLIAHLRIQESETSGQTKT